MKNLLRTVFILVIVNTVCAERYSYGQLFRRQNNFQNGVVTGPTYYYSSAQTWSYFTYEQQLPVSVEDFVVWLNTTREQYGLYRVVLDADLSAWAALNNQYQRSYGMGHHIMGVARRQNSAAVLASPGAAWLASPPHASALLDPTITTVGIHFDGYYWTFNAR